MVKPVIVIISIFILAVAINRIPFFDSKDYSYRPVTVRPSMTVVSRQSEPPALCDVIDYMSLGPVERGLPFTIIETLDDECGVFYNNPNYYLKIYPVGILLNLIIFVGFGFGLYKIITIRKSKEK